MATAVINKQQQYSEKVTALGEILTELPISLRGRKSSNYNNKIYIALMELGVDGPVLRLHEPVNAQQYARIVSAMQYRAQRDGIALRSAREQLPTGESKMWKLSLRLVNLAKQVKKVK